MTIAVFDSGVDSGHHDFRIEYSTRPTSRIIEQLDFTLGQPSTQTRNTADEYGHGTHVTGIIAGNGSTSGVTIEGVAPYARILSVKVLDADGTGLTSNLIAAIDWVIQKKDLYGVVVANLYLGHPSLESYTTDPLCQAARRMVESDIVTVVSAGNLGKTAEHAKVWGGISSPATEPSVITVGAVNTSGTLTHADDLATTYSSRGPTLYDGLFKPDLVAPGNGIASAKAASSQLDTDYPELSIDASYMSLSGSSMSTAFVSGTVALMLDANPDLNVNLVKSILLLTATKLTDLHPLEQGNGMLNAYTAVQLAEQVDVAGQQILANVEPYWILNGEYGWEEV